MVAVLEQEAADVGVDPVVAEPLVGERALGEVEPDRVVAELPGDSISMGVRA
ncbi:MAG: hypothetical protein U0R24_10365 [Solirubrobacterales bacterium]